MDFGAAGRNGGFHAMTSNLLASSAENRSDSRTVTHRSFFFAFTIVHRTASGLISTAVTLAPARAAQRATTPAPHPISSKDLSRSDSDETNLARIDVEPKYRG